MRKLINKTLGDPLLKNNAILFAGSILTGALNYALYPVLSRVLGVAEFGEVQVLLSLLLQFSVLSGIVRLFVITTVNDESKDSSHLQFIRNTEKSLLYLSLAGAATIILLAPWLRDFLQFDSIFAFLPLGFIFVVNLQFIVRTGFMQAKKAFSLVAVQQAAQAGSKLTFAILAAALGFGVGGVMWAVFGASLVALWLARTRSATLLPGLSSSSSKAATKAAFAGKQLIKQSSHLVLSGVVALSIFGLLSFDTIIVKHFFTPEEAGRYAGVAVVARAIFFVTASVSAVLIASVNRKQSIKVNTKTLLSSLVLLSAIGGTGVLLVGAFDDLAIKVLVGSDFLGLGDLLFKLSMAVFFVSILNVLLYYHLSMRDYVMGWIAAIGTLLSYIWVYNNHDSFDQVADSFIVASIWFLAVAAAWSATWHIKKFKEHRADAA